MAKDVNVYSFFQINVIWTIYAIIFISCSFSSLLCMNNFKSQPFIRLIRACKFYTGSEEVAPTGISKEFHTETLTDDLHCCSVFSLQQQVWLVQKCIPSYVLVNIRFFVVHTFFKTIRQKKKKICHQDEVLLIKFCLDLVSSIIVCFHILV